MTEWIISSSVLILIVTAMRYMLKGRISLKLQYALWGLVLIRLLMPFTLFESPVSIMNVVSEQPPTEYVNPAPDAYTPGNIPGFDVNDTEWIPGTYEPHASVTPVGGADGGEVNVITPWNEKTAVTVKEILTIVWIAGMAAVGGCLLASNLVFAARLRRSRIPTVKKDGVVIYVTEAVATPCLFGLFRPAIYVTPEVVKNDAVLRHVLEHELSHKRRGDHIWSALRGVCLALHWYNPLVWLAAELSRRDGELACDEATIKRIGEGERMDYGRTLIGLTCTKRTAGTLLVAATTMTGSKKTIKERIKLIAKKPHTAVITLVIVILVVLITVGFTFSGAEEADSVDTPWNWAQTLTAGNVESAEVWQNFSDFSYELTHDEKRELVRLLNGLEKGDFTENSKLNGGTPTYGLTVRTADGKYNINEANGPYGSLEMVGYGESQWWIDSEELAEFIRGLSGKAADRSAHSETVGETVAEYVVDTVAIYSNGEYVKPYLQHTWSELWTENGWASATPKLNLDKTRIEALGDEVPTVILAADFNVLYADNVGGGYKKNVYDSNFKIVSSDIYSLLWLEAGEYYCTFEISVTGEFIESEGRYESEGYLALFRLVVEEDGAKPLTPADAHDIVSAELRTRMGVYVLNEENDPNGEKLGRLVSALSSAGASGATKCPFYTTSLYLTRADGEVFMTLPAEDNCSIYLSEDRYYSYGSDFNGIFNLFGVRTDWEEREYNEDNLLTRISYVSWGQVYGVRDYTYDGSGYCVEEKYTDIEGVVTSRQEWDYKDGKCIESRLYDYGKLYRRITYTYDAAGDLLEQMSYDENGDKYIRYTYTYENGNCASMEFHCYADEGHYTEKYGYDRRGNRIKVETYDENDRLSYWHEYEYDDGGVCVRELRYLSTGVLETYWEFEYEFDKNVKWVSQYDGGGRFVEKWQSEIEPEVLD